jgi:hypothetical protein
MTFDDPTLFDLAGDKLLPRLEHKISLTAHGGDARRTALPWSARIAAKC